MQNKNKIKQLVKSKCAPYLGDKHGISNYCCWKDGSCVFFENENPLPSCRYFENCVLPMDEKLEREYKLERNMYVEHKVAKPKVSCKKCGNSFEDRQHYCEKCKKQNAREKIKLRVRIM